MPNSLRSSNRCLEPSPSKRFPNPQAVLTAIDAWQLRRVRRPLLYLTGVGFALLFLVMVAVGTYVFWTSVHTAESGVVNRSLEANRFAAQTEAKQFAAQIQLRWVQLEAASRNVRLREILAKGDGLKGDPAAAVELDQLLAERKQRGDRQFPASDKSSVWFADDAAGYQRGTAPPYPLHRHQYRGYRDYFHWPWRTARYNSASAAGDDPRAAPLGGVPPQAGYRRSNLVGRRSACL